MRHLIPFALLIALPSFADVTIINVTNSVTAYNEAAGSFSASSSDSIRINAQITDGVTNLNFNQGGGHTFAVYLYSLTDSPKWLVYSNANDTAAVASLEQGQVRFTIDPQEAGVYELYAEAIPVNDPSARYPIAWHTLTVTNAPSASYISLSLVPLIPSNGTIGTLFSPWRELYAVDGYFAGSLTVGGDVNVEGGFEALDSTKVAKVGETNHVMLTNAPVYVSTPTNGLMVANKDYADGKLLQGSASINGQPITNDAVFTIAGGGAGATGLVWLATYDPMLNGFTNTFTFSGIPTNGVALKMFSSLNVSNTSGGARNQGMRGNGNTNSIYSWTQIRSLNGATPSMTGAYGDTYATAMWSQSNLSNGVTSIDFTITDYATTNANKGYVSTQSVFYNSLGQTGLPNTSYIGTHYGEIRTLDPITNLTVFSIQGDNYVSGRCDLYMVTK